MSIELCSSCGTSPAEYAKKLHQIDSDNSTKPKNISHNQTESAQTPTIDANRPLDIVT